MLNDHSLKVSEDFSQFFGGFKPAAGIRRIATFGQEAMEERMFPHHLCRWRVQKPQAPRRLRVQQASAYTQEIEVALGAGAEVSRGVAEGVGAIGTAGS
jgi:hypothetical protein